MKELNELVGSIDAEKKIKRMLGIADEPEQ